MPGKKSFFHAVYLIFALCLPLTATAFEPPIVPDPVKTPGDVLTTDRDTVCAKDYTKTVRAVSAKKKNQIYLDYGIVERKAREYEIDHLISLELGGSNEERNLWPESYKTQPLNARTKDKLENRMHELVCKGELDLKQAQVEIARDWKAAYVKHVGPLPDGTMLSQDDQQSAGGCPDSMPIKGSNNGIYHVPGDSHYQQTTHPRTCFATLAKAEAAGYRPAKTKQ